MEATTHAPRYDSIGKGYASRRREDPGLRMRILEALGGAQRVVTAGAAAGSYEPKDRLVLAVEPSGVMASQRPRQRPAIRGVATALPFHDGAVDAAMTVLSMHHWHPHQREGVKELCRVARNRVVIVTIDPLFSARMWLMADYLHEVRDLDLTIFPAPETIQGWLDRPARIEAVPLARDTPDHSLMSFWAHPERVLDPDARAATSGFARQPAAVVSRVVRAVQDDLASGAWDERHGAMRELDFFDAGLRMIVAEGAS